MRITPPRCINWSVLTKWNSKRKLGNDPNNTKWSRNTDSFGQKLLRAQGWQPGEYLGATGAAHAEWHTQANSTHIQVTLKDDTLGLGAKRNNGDECTGLDAFQHLLGRLNGKSDDTLEAERKVREDVKLSLYVERKYGTIRFVKGGFLVGDQVTKTPSGEPEDATSDPVSEAPQVPLEAEAPKKSKSKKRKADQDAEPEDDKARKKDKKSKKRKTEPEVDDQIPAPACSIDNLSEVKVAKEKRDKKKEKKDKKLKEKGKKEKRRKEKSSESSTDTSETVSKEKKRRKKDSGSEKEPQTTVESSLPTPNTSGTSTPVPTGSSRYLARSRFIAQKKMAFSDSVALNQVRLTSQTIPWLIID